MVPEIEGLHSISLYDQSPLLGYRTPVNIIQELEKSLGIFIEGAYFLGEFNGDINRLRENITRSFHPEEIEKQLEQVSKDSRLISRLLAGLDIERMDDIVYEREGESLQSLFLNEDPSSPSSEEWIEEMVVHSELTQLTPEEATTFIRENVQNNLDTIINTDLPDIANPEIGTLIRNSPRLLRELKFLYSNWWEENTQPDTLSDGGATIGEVILRIIIFLILGMISIIAIPILGVGLSPAVIAKAFISSAILTLIDSSLSRIVGKWLWTPRIETKDRTDIPGDGSEKIHIFAAGKSGTEFLQSYLDWGFLRESYIDNQPGIMAVYEGYPSKEIKFVGRVKNVVQAGDLPYYEELNGLSFNDNQAVLKLKAPLWKLSKSTRIKADTQYVANTLITNLDKFWRANWVSDLS